MESYHRLEQLLQSYVTNYTEPNLVELTTNLEKLNAAQIAKAVTFTTAASGATSGLTVIHIAAVNNHPALIQIILDSVTSVTRCELLSIQDSREWTALHYAAYKRNEAVVTAMLAKLTPEDIFDLLKIQDLNGHTALHSAVQNQQSELLLQPVKFDKPNPQNRKDTYNGLLKSLLGRVSQANLLELLQIQNEWNETAVHLAISNEQTDAMQLLETELPHLYQQMLLAIHNGEKKPTQDASAKGKVQTDFTIITKREASNTNREGRIAKENEDEVDFLPLSHKSKLDDDLDQAKLQRPPGIAKKNEDEVHLLSLCHKLTAGTRDQKDYHRPPAFSCLLREDRPTEDRPTEDRPTEDRPTEAFPFTQEYGCKKKKRWPKVDLGKGDIYLLMLKFWKFLSKKHGQSQQKDTECYQAAHDNEKLIVQRSDDIPGISQLGENEEIWTGGRWSNQWKSGDQQIIQHMQKVLLQECNKIQAMDEGIFKPDDDADTEVVEVNNFSYTPKEAAEAVAVTNTAEVGIVDELEVKMKVEMEEDSVENGCSILEEADKDMGQEMSVVTAAVGERESVDEGDETKVKNVRIFIVYMSHGQEEEPRSEDLEWTVGHGSYRCIIYMAIWTGWPSYSPDDDDEATNQETDTIYIRQIVGYILLAVGNGLSIVNSTSAEPLAHNRHRRTYRNNEDSKKGLPEHKDDARHASEKALCPLQLSNAGARGDDNKGNASSLSPTVYPTLGLSADEVISAADQSEKIDQGWVQSINNAETLQRYQGQGALCSWTLCLAIQLVTVIAHTQLAVWYSIVTRAEPTEFPDLKEKDAALLPHTSPEVAGYIHSSQLEWMFYPFRHGISCAVPYAQPCDVVCEMADMQTYNQNGGQGEENGGQGEENGGDDKNGEENGGGDQNDGQGEENGGDDKNGGQGEGNNGRGEENGEKDHGNEREEKDKMCPRESLTDFLKDHALERKKLLLVERQRSFLHNCLHDNVKMSQKYIAQTPSLVPDNLKWIFNPSLHGIPSAVPPPPSYFTDVLCYPVGYFDNATAVPDQLPMSLQHQLDKRDVTTGTSGKLLEDSGDLKDAEEQNGMQSNERESSLPAASVNELVDGERLDVLLEPDSVLVQELELAKFKIAELETELAGYPSDAGRGSHELRDIVKRLMVLLTAELKNAEQGVQLADPPAMGQRFSPDDPDPSIDEVDSSVSRRRGFFSLEDEFKSTKYSAYEKVEKMLAKYVSNTWYTPGTSELKQYLQAVSADGRFKLLKRYRWADYTALYVAAERGDTEVMRCLLEIVEPQKRYELLKIQECWRGETPLHAAARSGITEVMRCMLELVEPENQIQLLDIPNKFNNTALDVAGGEETVQLIRQYRESDEREIAVRWLRWLMDDKTNPLAFGHPPTDGALHWRQSNVNNNNPSGMSYCEKLWDMLADYVCNPWHTLDTSVLKQYLQAISADVRFELLKKKNENGTTTIHEAAERGHTRVITALLEVVEPERRYELLKMQNRCGKPVLNVAAERGDARAMRCLLEQVEPGSVHELLKIRNEFPFRYGFMYGKTAIEEAAWRGHTKVTNAMLAMVEPENQLELLDIPHWRVGGEKMAKVIHQYRRRAEFAVMEKLERLLAVYVYVPWSRLNTSELQQCLQAFSAGKRFELLKKQCGRGTTALHQAAKRGHTEVMRCLLKLIEARKRHELLKKQDVSSSTPLHAAARSGGTEAVRCMLELVELEDQVQLLNTPDWLSRTALDVAKGDKPTQIMRQCGESTAGKFRESPRRQRTATEGGCLLESHLHPTSRAFAMPCKDDANTLNEPISTGDPHHGERSHKVPMVEKAIEPTQVVREETTQATQEGREKSVLQQNALGDNTPVSLIPSNVVFQSDQSSLSLSESVPRPASTYQEEPSCSAPNVHGFQSSKMPSKQPLAGNHCLKSVDCKPPSIGANILQDTNCGSSANEKKYFAVTAAHSFLSENDVKWIFNPSRHGISSAIPSYNREIACYPIARYPDNQNPLLPLSLQKKLAEMSPREYLSAVLRELSLEERESLMIDEKQRRNTFLVNWPHDSNLSGVKLAQAGFYCVDDYDRVQCVFCRGSLHKWEAEDNPMTEHAKLFPFCRFVKGLECGNKEYKNDLLLADELKNITLLTMPEMKKNRDGSVSTNSGAFGISTNKAAVIKYAPYETRKNTYGRWPAANVIRPEPLCEAGFYYTGFDDQVRCFFCSGGLREWSSEDNPWEEHARWFPDCSYLLQHKGEIYVTEVHARTEDGKKCPRKTVLQKKTEKEWKQKVSTQQAMYELIVVKLNHDRRAVDIAINRNGKTFESAKEMVEAVYQVEEDGNMDSDRMETDYQAIKPAIDFMAAAAKDQPIIVQEAGMGTDMVDGLQPGRMDTADSGPPPASCKTCYKKTSQVVQASQVGLPCGHLIYCDKCIQDEKLKTDRNNGYKSRCPAPQCAAVLTGAIKAFLN